MRYEGAYRVGGGISTSPAVVGTDRAVLPCGCYVVVGHRIDTHELSTASVPCSPEHRKSVMARFQVALLESLKPENLTDRDLIDVVDELLESSRRHYEG
jgi:hypothetical protein